MPEIRTLDIALPPDRSENEEALRGAVAYELGCDPARIRELRILRRSLDARQRRVVARLRLEAGLDTSLPPAPCWEADFPPFRPDADPVLIVGCGPAGLFAALRCLELGRRPLVLERGKDVASRRFDLAPILRQGRVPPDSNYCFGEGGAGTFSDGKLYTRCRKRGSVERVYRILVSHGAPERILTDAHPHIGSNLLPGIVRSLRKTIIGAGGEVRFGTRVVGLRIRQGRIRGVETARGDAVPSGTVILATGHSARDIYRLLEQTGIAIEPKPFAIGVRIEHPQNLLDRTLYHLPPDASRPDCLPASGYRLATRVGRRGVHSFCVCPGGFIVPAATGNDEVVVNGMSLSRRDSAFINGGMVVTVEPEDTGPGGALRGVSFQQGIEALARRAGGGRQRAPGQRLPDFLAGRHSGDLPATSYRPGVVPARLDLLLPDWIAAALRRALPRFGRKLPGFLDREALLVGFETRTSAPVRIPRDPSTLQHPGVEGLYPCGEGAGHAGGIASAALDGIRCAEAACGIRASA